MHLPSTDPPKIKIVQVHEKCSCALKALKLYIEGAIPKVMRSLKIK